MIFVIAKVGHALGFLDPGVPYHYYHLFNFMCKRFKLLLTSILETRLLDSNAVRPTIVEVQRVWRIAVDAVHLGRNCDRATFLGRDGSIFHLVNVLAASQTFHCYFANFLVLTRSVNFATLYRFVVAYRNAEVSVEQSVKFERIFVLVLDDKHGLEGFGSQRDGVGQAERMRPSLSELAVKLVVLQGYQNISTDPPYHTRFDDLPNRTATSSLSVSRPMYSQYELRAKPTMIFFSGGVEYKPVDRGNYHAEEAGFSPLCRRWGIRVGYRRGWPCCRRVSPFH